MGDLFGEPDAGPAARPETLPGLAQAAAACTRCPLYRDATQVVVGEGPPDAGLMLVGEQPGDREDMAGRPFVGPAGQLLDTALERVGIDRSAAFVTNAVKHFKHELRGRRRIHQKPDTSEVDHCRWWLSAERHIVRPRLIVALGATAARGVIGKPVTISRVRGTVRPVLPVTDEPEAHALVTVHPSFLLRITEEARKRTEWHAFLGDLETARDWLARAG